MEGSIGSRMCRGVRSCWAHQWPRSYRRLAPAPATPRRPARAAAAFGGIRLGRRPAAAWIRFAQLRAEHVRWWPSPRLQLLCRVVGAYLSTVLPRRMLQERTESLDDATAARLRRGASKRHGGVDHGRGVVLNLCVAEALLLRRSSSVTRRSPLRTRKTARTERTSILSSLISNCR
uniref:Uncharacterized protein n=1 Tax=Leersia perrieri TaxID=77586 RepID=A0A0D9V2R0_9ORYZ